jgi:hypothetical protein
MLALVMGEIELTVKRALQSDVRNRAAVDAGCLYGLATSPPDATVHS